MNIIKFGVCITRYLPLYNNSAGAMSRNEAFYGTGTGPIVLSNVNCNGTEMSLLACPATMSHNCVPNEAAGVRCPYGTVYSYSHYTIEIRSQCYQVYGYIHIL